LKESDLFSSLEDDEIGDPEQLGNLGLPHSTPVQDLHTIPLQSGGDTRARTYTSHFDSLFLVEQISTKNMANVNETEFRKLLKNGAKLYS
jgi:hypothetical protein